MKLTPGELSALQSGGEIADAQEAGRNGMYKMCYHISKRRATHGFSEADIMEGLASGCDATDISYYTFTVLEYVFRYTTKYGAAAVVVLGVIEVLTKAASAGSALFGMIFGSSSTTKQDASKDNKVRQDWFSMGLPAGLLIGALISGLIILLPPALRTLIEQFSSPEAKKTAGLGAGPVNVAGTTGTGTAGSAFSGGAPAPGSLGAAVISTLRQDRTVRDMRVRDQGITAGQLGIAKRRI